MIDKQERLWVDELLKEWGLWWRHARAARPQLGYGRSPLARCLDDMRSIRCPVCAGRGHPGHVQVVTEKGKAKQKCPVCKGLGVIRPDRRNREVNPAFIRPTFVADDLDNEPEVYRRIDAVLKTLNERRRLVLLAHYVICPDDPNWLRKNVVSSRLVRLGQKKISLRTYERELTTVRELVAESLTERRVQAV